MRVDDQAASAGVDDKRIGRWTNVVRPALRWPVWVLLVAALLIFGVAYQIRTPYSLDIGTPVDRAFTANAGQPEATARDTFRRLSPDSTFTFPGIGGYRFRLSLRTQAATTNTPDPVTVLVNGRQVGTLRAARGWQTDTFDVDDPTLYTSNNISVELREAAAIARRDVGGSLRLSTISIVPRDESFSRIVLPSPLIIAYLLALVALLYLLIYGLAARAMTIIWLSHHQNAGMISIEKIAAGLASLSLPPLAYAVANARNIVATQAVAWLLILVLAAALYVALERIGRQFYRRLGLDVTQGEVVAVAGLVAVFFALKMAALLYPTTSVTDLPFHQSFVELAMHGHIADIYLPNDQITLAKPPKDWGMDALFPKFSPLYLLVAPLGYLPIALDATLRVVAVLIDLAFVPLVFYLARRVLGLDALGGFFATLVFCLTTVTFRLLILGTYPSLFAQLLTLITFSFICVNLPRLNRWRYFVGAALLLALTFISFPTMVLFNGLSLAFVVVALQFARQHIGVQRQPLWLAGVLLAGGAVAFVAYYVWWLPPILQKTLPAYIGQVNGTGARTGRASGLGDVIAWSFWGDAKGYSFYGSPVPVALAIAGMLLGALALSGNIAMRDQTLRDLRPVGYIFSVCWFAIMPLFIPLNVITDLIGKHLIYVVVPVAVFAGAALAWLWQRRTWWARLLVVAALVQLTWSSLAFVVARLA